MLNLILDSIGEEIVLNAGFDLTGLTLSMNFRPELGKPVSVVAQLGVVDRPSESLLAGEYATYGLGDGILTKTGRWQKQLGYGAKKLRWVNFNVV